MTTVVAAPPPSVSALSVMSGTPPKDRCPSPLRFVGLPPRSMSTSGGAPSAAAAAPPPPPSPPPPSQLPPIARSSPTPNVTSAPSAAAVTGRPPRSSPRSHGSPESAARSPPSRSASDDKVSPSSQRAPLIRVKKEPASPQMHSRPRPRRLDLSSGGSHHLRGPQTAGAGPIPSKESAGLAIKDLGVACLSPGFQTQDPSLREQLQRSLSVRDQQRQLIEARQKGSAKPLTANDAGGSPARRGGGDADREAPQAARRKGPPPGLSIHTPAASTFAHERVIQSAPLGQSFTGLRHHHEDVPARAPSNLAQAGHVHHVPARQTDNRLPPLADVFHRDRIDAPPSASFRPSGPHPAASPAHPPLPSPGFTPNQPQHHHQHHHHHHQGHGHGPGQPSSSRAREFRSAEEAVQSMTGGREELLPKVVHYGGTQPPTPPSPGQHHHHQHLPHQQHLHHQQQQAQQHHQDPRPHQPTHSSHAHAYPPHQHSPYDRPDPIRQSSTSSRRRTRDEYERDHLSPAVYPGEFKRYAPERERDDDWRHGLSTREKRDEFLRLCERAWDLFHS